MLKLYPKLAWQNLRKNYRVTVPYLLSGAGMVMLYYIIYSLAIGCGQSEFYGARSTASMMVFGIYVVAVLAAIFLFYTNSFVIKRRKKELGLYNILGMEKRHIAGVILTETLITALVCLGAGLGLGLAFSKAFFLMIEKLSGSPVPIAFVVSPVVFLHAVLIFGGIFLFSGCYNILQVRLSKPIELLHGGEIGEKEPKGHWVLAVLGAGLLGAGYYLAVSITDPMTALALFFVAVILVILGTYLVFMVGITAMLKLLKKNKGFYYQTRHFTTVSGMLYRMKQNAAGLASICILFTCLLVTVSTTFCLYTGVEDAVNRLCPQDIELTTSGLQEEERERIRQKAQEACANRDARMENVFERREWLFACSRVEDTLYVNDGLAGSTYAALELYTLEDYNRYSGQSRSLAPDQALLYDPENRYSFDRVTVFGKTYQVEKIDLPGGKAKDVSYLMGYEKYALVLNDPELIVGDKLTPPGKDSDQSYYMAEYVFRFDVAGHNPQTVKDVYNEISDWIDLDVNQWGVVQKGEGFSLSRDCRPYQKEDLAGLYGGVFFLGLFMGVVFLLGTALIIYYKQVSEGYEDAKRFKIMQDVGMSHQEVKKSIHSQVLMVFFLPLFTALLHLSFAFPMLQKILGLMNMVNFQLIVSSMAGCVLVFSVCYLLIYLRTARTYYKIVESSFGSSGKRRGAHHQS